MTGVGNSGRLTDFDVIVVLDFFSLSFPAPRSNAEIELSRKYSLHKRLKFKDLRIPRPDWSVVLSVPRY